jgi:hypothetical protein
MRAKRQRQDATRDTAGIMGHSPRLLRTKDAACYLGVPYNTLRDWTARDIVPVIRVPRCRILWFDRRDLDDFIARYRETHDTDRLDPHPRTRREVP